MNTKLYVGNLAITATEKVLQSLFSPYGNVAEVHLTTERGIGPLGSFAVVTMATPHGAQAAISALNGKEVEARVLTVTEHVTARRMPPAAAQKESVPRRW
jgi:multiple RNA-binding domain-containing protein 1